MEPAVGILRIPPTSFLKPCVICTQTHGSCTTCCKCDTHFHAICASRAGYSMELHSQLKNGKQVTTKLIYCAVHRTLNPEAVIVIRTPWAVFAAKSLLQNEKGFFRASRVPSSNKTEAPEPSTSLESYELEEPLSAAKCRASFKGGERLPIIHRPRGATHHSLDVIDSLNTHKLVEYDSKAFSSFKDRLSHLQKTEAHRFCFGKSGIHKWGLFARRNIQQGEMVIEYRGEQVRGSVADVREARIISVGEQNRVVLIAKTNVSEGEELTYDYLFEPDERDELRVPCLCLEVRNHCWDRFQENNTGVYSSEAVTLAIFLNGTLKLLNAEPLLQMQHFLSRISSSSNFQPLSGNLKTLLKPSVIYIRILYLDELQRMQELQRGGTTRP
ncbi:hypothetical protein ACLB2K_001827 [Fragaria x ananassa]